jgi:hypothetical protein
MKWWVRDPAEVQVKAERNQKVMFWESIVEASKNEEKKHVVNSQHDGKLPGLPSLKGNEKQHECRKCKKWCYD